jgi:hypothetical protein
MSAVKEQFIKLIEDQPEDSSSEEIIREMAFAAMVDRGIADSDAGRAISNPPDHPRGYPDIDS